MKRITRRQLSREPARLKGIKPGESVIVPDENGGLLVTRRKKNRLTADEMLAQLDALPGTWPKVDARSLEDDP
jgi:hypothetical protein